MNLDIALDADAEEVHVVLDNQLVLCAHRDSEDRIVFSRNFSRIDDNQVDALIRDICRRTLNLSSAP